MIVLACVTCVYMWKSAHTAQYGGCWPMRKLKSFSTLKLRGLLCHMGASSLAQGSVSSGSAAGTWISVEWKSSWERANSDAPINEQHETDPNRHHWSSLWAGDASTATCWVAAVSSSCFYSLSLPQFHAEKKAREAFISFGYALWKCFILSLFLKHYLWCLWNKPNIFHLH